MISSRREVDCFIRWLVLLEEYIDERSFFSARKNTSVMERLCRVRKGIRKPAISLELKKI